MTENEDLIRALNEAENRVDLRSLEQLVTDDICFNTWDPDSSGIGREDYLQAVAEWAIDFPFASGGVTSVTTTRWGAVANIRNAVTHIESGRRLQYEALHAYRFQRGRVAEIWVAQRNRASFPSPPNVFEFKYIGGWPGLDDPIEAVSIRIESGRLEIAPGRIPDTSLATHILAGASAKPSEPIAERRIAEIVGSNVGGGRSVDHGASASDVGWGALTGAVLFRPALMSMGLTSGASVAAGAGIAGRLVAKAGQWVQGLDRIVLVLQAPGQDPALCLFEELPVLAKDKRKLPTGTTGQTSAVALWDRIQAARLEAGWFPMRSLSVLTANEAPPTEEQRGQPAAPSSGGGKEMEASIAQRLATLQSLRDKGLITDSDFESKKAAILADL